MSNGRIPLPMPEFHCTREAEASHRIPRLRVTLRRAVRALCRLNPAAKGGILRKTLGSIVSLGDHKGELTVVWNRQPSEREEQAFRDAWAAASELPEHVIHIVV